MLFLENIWNNAICNIGKYCFFIFLFSLVSCSLRTDEIIERNFDDICLQDGDLVFRKGKSVTSRLVLAAKKDNNFSHVGIVAKIDNSFKIIHCVPDDFENSDGEEIIKCENLEKFFSFDNAVTGAVFRLENFDTISLLASKKAVEFFNQKIKFDHDLDLKDSSKMYCTELIFCCFNSIGVDITKGQRTVFPTVKKEFLFPNDILKNNNFKLIYQFP
ncbi:MAG: hypothetical protein LBV69_01400 [Bacteroidales bacterium]|jgi:hypothetical protein|nr:hypothetical protein [Bacteroidales bacterium]